MANTFDYESTSHRMDSGIKLDRPSPTTLPAIAEESKPEPVQVRKSKTKEPVSTRDQFNGTSTAIQLKLDSELIQSLKLHAISHGQTMSELVMSCLTSKDMIKRAWVSTRQNAS